MMRPSYPTLKMQGIGQINAACHQELRLEHTANEKMRYRSRTSGMKNRLERSLRHQTVAIQAMLIAKP